LSKELSTLVEDESIFDDVAPFLFGVIFPTKDGAADSKFFLSHSTSTEE